MGEVWREEWGEAEWVSVCKLAVGWGGECCGMQGRRNLCPLDAWDYNWGVP